SPPLAGGDRGEGKQNLIVHPSPSQRLSLRGRSPSGAEPEPAATLTLPPAFDEAPARRTRLRQAGLRAGRGEGNNLN
ncbi:MAG: hypothetical protein Q8P64_28365, partial [Deltaproteobacteria bacterium]|nr:hypothetical protein [Deltaproteobacteria bacterium]